MLVSLGFSQEASLSNNNMNYEIRNETKDDYASVHILNQLAFNGHAEAKLVDDLRQSGDVVISLVAEKDAEIVGHVLFSKLHEPEKALALAPVAVSPPYQRQGVGSAIIREGLRRAKADGWLCVFVLGDPAYYGRFGFSVDAAKGYIGPYSGDHFMILSFGDVPETGETIYAAPFKLLD